MNQRECRCPRCGALASADATWCGQCFGSLASVEEARPAADDRPATGPSAAPTEGAAAVATKDRPAPSATWPCPVCQTDNPIERDTCRACGTSFATLLRDEPRPRTVDPRDAFVRSLLFPGLGHRMIGRGGDGLARAVLVLMTLAIAAVTIASGRGGGSGVAAVGALFGALALVAYLGTAFEAARMARGRPAAVTSRGILWIVVGLLIGSVLILALLVVSAGSASP